MECIEAIALKSSCFSQFSMRYSTRSSTHLFSDDTWCSADGIDGVFPVSAADDFSVDEFFDLPTTPERRLVEEDEEDEAKESSALSLSSLDDGHSNSSSAVSASIPAQDDLTFQVEDMEELELWSHLMDDSVPESSSCPFARTGTHLSNRFEPKTKPVPCNSPCITATFPVRPRSKLPRKIRLQVRPCGPTPIPEVSSSAAMGGVMFMNPGERAQRKKAEEERGVQQRRCSHCQAQKTPQWRAGPLGPKTLCNACGVRFKKGRLFPEYRPACSPMFSRGIHSNSHRKVMEMRRKKEMTMTVSEGKPRSGLVVAGC